MSQDINLNIECPENLKSNIGEHLENLGLDHRIILKINLGEKWL
jgi:hypothetical protein